MVRWWLLLSLFLVPAAVSAGPNAGGTLVVHDANLLLSATDGSISICGQGVGPDSCGAVDAELDSTDANTPRIWVVYAAFPDSSSPRLMGVTWGIHYQPDSLSILLSGKCGDFELNDDNWPDPDTGSSVTWDTAQTGLLVPVYWFAGYQYTATPTTFDLRDHPSQGGDFGDDSTPAVLDSVTAYAKLGFGMAGEVPCPGPGDEADGENEPGDGESGEDSSGGEEPDNPPEGDPPPDTGNCAPNVVLIRFAPGEVAFLEEDPRLHQHFVLPIQAAAFSRSDLEERLRDLGAETFETVAPRWRHMTPEEEVDIHGRHVDLVDFTDVYRVQLDGRASLDQVITSLRHRPGIEHTECDLIGTSLMVDSLWSEQWYFHNGRLGFPRCGTPGFDVKVIEAWSYQDSAGTKIGISDDDGIDTTLVGISGYVDTTLSRSFVDGPWWTTNGNSHATGVASIAATGTLDDAPLASIPNLPANHDDSLIVSLRVDGDETAAVAALAHVTSDAVGGRVRVVNHSWGYVGAPPHCKLSHDYPMDLRNAFRNAFLCDISLVCAAGNFFEPSWCPGDTFFVFPAAYADYALAVSSVDCYQRPNLIHFRGSYIDLAAPGWQIWYLSETGPSRNEGWSGTSDSAPLVSGAISLLLGADPDLTNEDCYNLLKQTAIPLSADPIWVGTGSLNVDGAVACTKGIRYVVHDSIPTFSGPEPDGEGVEAILRQVPGINPTEDELPFLVDRYRLTWSASISLSSPSWVERVWARGKTSSGWRKIDQSIDYYYDGLFYTNHADVNWNGGNNPTFTSYVYWIRQIVNGDTIPRGWAPFDPYDPPATAQVTFSYVVNTLEPAAVENAAGPDRSFRAQARNGQWLFELPPGIAAPFSIEIYNVAGRQIQVLSVGTEGNRVGGVWWNGRDAGGRRVASGLYFARLRDSGGPAQSPSQAVRLLIVR